MNPKSWALHSGPSSGRDALLFIGLTILLSWLFWLPGSILGGGSAAGRFLLALGSFAPLAVAFYLNRWSGRTTFEWRSWLRTLAVGKVVLALLLPAMWLAPVILLRVYLNTIEPVKLAADIRDGGVMLLGFTVLAFGEEVGWRGFLLARLQSLNLALINLLTGLLWFVWQLPLVLHASSDAFSNDTGRWLGSFFLFAVLVTPFLNRLALHSQLNVLLPTLLRAAMNTAFAIYLLQTPLDALTHPYGAGVLAWLLALNVLLLAPLWFGKRAGGAESELELVMPLEPATK